MSTELERLQQALAERYAVAGVLGEGGMATVYRATDLKHRRDVAIKVLRPEISHALGAKRFLQEIEIAAGLQHPRILALYDSGEADGFLYYVMPLVEGESLRDRLTREKQMSVEDSVRIAREIASALAYAHARGIVHRDIKPENILISGGEAVVADFGIALALKAAGGSRLTMTGVSIGTPAYMSPEQASGDWDVDSRADVYSLGCVLYEMLAGLPPFTGRTVESLVRQHIAAPVPRISVVRPTVSPALEDAIEQALQKTPADRTKSAAEFLASLDAPLAKKRRANTRISLSVSPLMKRLAAVVVIVAAVGIAAQLLSKRVNAPTPDPSLIAVLPFMVSGDSSDAFLREGMVDLLSTQLGSMTGARSLDARTVLTSWRRAIPEGDDPTEGEARRLSMGLGSGRFVLGTIIGAQELAISARLIDVDDGQIADGRVSGPRDSLFALVDQLTSKLIASTVNEPARRLTELTSASLPAVRAYLEGRAALRAGAVERAREKFTAALELDSTFALAALGMASSGVWSQQSGQSAALRRGLLTGYALRERLSRRDQLLFEAWVRPYSAAGHSAQDQMLAWRRAVTAAPESPEALYEYGDRVYHSGEHLGMPDARVRAESLFARALALDSTYAQPLAHLMEIAVRVGDRRAARRLAALSGVESMTADAGDYVRWRVALVSGDQRMLQRLRGRMDSMPQASINRIIGFGLTDGVDMKDIDSAAAELRRRVDAGTTSGNVHPGQTLHNWALNRGRRAEVARAIAAIQASEPLVAGSSIVFFGADQVPVLDALYWDGDSLAAVDAAGRIERSLPASAPRESAARARFYTNLCIVALWKQSIGSSAAARPMIEQLRAGSALRDSAAVHGASPRLCLTVLDAMTATAARADEATTMVARLDSILASAPYVFGSDWGNLALARIYEQRSDTASALRVVRRRPYDWDTGPLYLSTYLREEGRLAATTGDVAGARVAYARYLALRAGADGEYRAQTASVERALAALR